MSDIAKVKETIKKLMAVANDGSASDAEIENAMKRAATLIDRHHIRPEDLKPGEEDAAPDDITMGLSFGKVKHAKIFLWEAIVAEAVEKLFGSVQYFRSEEKHSTRASFISGPAKTVRMIGFYGPAAEAAEAAAFFETWIHAVATLALGRWGNPYRGNGGVYALGFSRKLRERAAAIDKARRAVAARPIAILAGEASTIPVGTAITLAERYDILKNRGTSYMEKVHGIKMVMIAPSGGSRGSAEAYQEGQSHGGAAAFERGPAKKLLQ